MIGALISVWVVIPFALLVVFPLQMQRHHHGVNSERKVGLATLLVLVLCAAGYLAIPRRVPATGTLNAVVMVQIGTQVFGTISKL